MGEALRTPVALVIYNRPDLAARVFAAIRQARPARLFVLADGPRPDRPGDAHRCAAARAAVEHVDWPCDVRRDYADANLGIRRRVDGGMGWLFSQVEEVILLEDDCVPDPTFFPFCQELLARYRDDDRVMMVSGNDYVAAEYALPASYAFTRYPLTWGWATWRRAWERYDPTLSRWPEVRSTRWLADFLGDPAAACYWSRIFETEYETRENWDYAWVLACWLHGGLCAFPAVNLVGNLGCRPDATHTTDPGDALAALAARPVAPLPPPWAAPAEVAADPRADALIERDVFSGRFFLRPLFDALRARVRSQRRG